MFRPIRSLLLVLALAGCDSPTALVTGDPAVQRQVWEAQSIDDYRYQFVHGCMCIDPPLPLVWVEVRDGRIVEVREVASRRLVPKERWEYVATVDQVFDHIARAPLEGRTPVDAKFHRELGYPMRVTLGTPADDGGVGYYLDRLEALE